MEPKKILFIEPFSDIQEIVAEHVADGLCEGFEVKVTGGLDQALNLIATDKYDGIIMDGLEATLEKRLTFIHKVRSILPEQSIVALLSEADFGLESEEKKQLTENKVSVAHKTQVLAADQIGRLFDASCHKGYGEEICFQEDTPS